MSLTLPVFGISTEEKTRVLVVDDSRAQGMLLASMMRKAGYDVVHVSSAEEALPLCEDPSISVIISDWSMPGMDGPEFCQALRQLDRPYAYFILVTSRDDRAERARGLDAGADDFVTRPIDWVELRARIRAGQRLIELHKKMAEQRQIVEHTLEQLQQIHEAVHVELQEARQLQQSLIPPREHHLNGGTIALNLVTCGQIGGDLVGHFRISNTKHAIYSIDVSGHGIASALMTGRLSGLFSSDDPLRNLAYSRGQTGDILLDPPDVVMTRVNEMMLAEMDTDIYFTCVLAYIDLTTGEVVFCQAGHPNPLHITAQGAVHSLGSGGPPVGLIGGVPYTNSTLHLKPGDRLMLHSDGLSEATSDAGDMLGQDGLERIAAEAESHHNTTFLEAIEEKVRCFIAPSVFDDDLSMLVFEYRP